MVVFIIMCLPASYIIDTYGIRKALGLGAILTAAGAVIKGFGAESLTLVFTGQFFLALAQPFILNSVTAFSVRWFAINERAIVAGLLALAQYIGILLAMVLTPLLVESSAESVHYGNGIDSMLMIYMIPSVISAVLFLIFFKEQPGDLPFDIGHERLNFKEGILNMFRLKDALLVLFLFTIGLGIFNSISTLVDHIAANLNITDSNGYIGGVMLIGGIIGALIIPFLSDHYRKRKLFLVLCMIIFIPTIFGLAFAGEISEYFQLSVQSTYDLALISSFLLGLSIMSAGPIVFQYTAEITAPTPEATSQGILLLAGQISGIVMVSIMTLNKNQYLDPMMKIFVILSVFGFIAVLLLKESDID
jgi:MFS family permease